MKYKKLLFSAITAFASITTNTIAKNPILENLEKKGVDVGIISDASLAKIKGAAVITGQPRPSYMVGTKNHHITYLKWVSVNDYRSYNYVGSDFSSGYSVKNFAEGSFLVAGDAWLADLKSNSTSWSLANSEVIEFHYQIIHPETKVPTEYALRESAWNRPITKFNW